MPDAANAETIQRKVAHFANFAVAAQVQGPSLYTYALPEGHEVRDVLADGYFSDRIADCLEEGDWLFVSGNGEAAIFVVAEREDRHVELARFSG